MVQKFIEIMALGLVFVILLAVSLGLTAGMVYVAAHIVKAVWEN